MPLLLSINAHAPHLHQTLEEVISLHLLPALVDVFHPGLPVLDRVELLVFLHLIDGTTPHFRSEGDVFRDTVRLQGTCPPLPVH